VQSTQDPLRWVRIAPALEAMGDEQRSLRNKAMVATAHATVLRRAELVALERKHFRRDPTEDHGHMVVAKTKADDATMEKCRHLTPEAVVHLERWLAAANITTGWLFCGITPDGRLRSNALGAGEVVRIFKGIARVAGLNDISRIAGHATRNWRDT
jgi:integrase